MKPYRLKRFIGEFFVYGLITYYTQNDGDLIDVFGTGSSEQRSASVIVLDLDVRLAVQQALYGSKLTVI